MQGAQKLRSEAHLQVRGNKKLKRNAADGLFTKPSPRFGHILPMGVFFVKAKIQLNVSLLFLSTTCCG
jgi:hypothetical protein